MSEPIMVKIISMAPTSNADAFPTILRILGLESDSPVDGRVIEEALVGGPEPDEVFVSTGILEGTADLGDVTYRQELQVSWVDSASYLDKGRASLS